MRAELLKATLKSLFPMQRTVCIEGAPGGGKTTIVHEVASELDVPIVERHVIKIAYLARAPIGKTKTRFKQRRRHQVVFPPSAM